MKRFMEKAAVLCLSLVLISAYSVSAALPQMKQFFHNYPPDWVEMLISVTSFAVVCTVAADIWLHRLISERTSITLGLVLVTVSGTVPVWSRSFGMIFASRILLGIGFGLVNACAITIIQERYTGREQAFLLGVRGSMETLGGAVLTLIAGGLLHGGWNHAFWIYITALPILAMFLAFVRPGEGNAKRAPDDKAKANRGPAPVKVSPAKVSPAKSADAAPGKVSPGPWTRGELLFLIFCALLAGLFIFVNTSNTMRLADVVIERGLGTDQKASVVLSVLQAVGVIGGIFYGKLRETLKGYVFPLTILIYALGDVMFGFAFSMPLMYLGAIFSGYGNGLLTTILFDRISDRLPAEKVSSGTHLTLIGCNLGATLTPVIMKLLGFINNSNTFLFFAYSAVLGVLAVYETVKAAKN